MGVIQSKLFASEKKLLLKDVGSKIDRVSVAFNTMTLMPLSKTRGYQNVWIALKGCERSYKPTNFSISTQVTSHDVEYQGTLSAVGQKIEKAHKDAIFDGEDSMTGIFNITGNLSEAVQALEQCQLLSEESAKHIRGFCQLSQSGKAIEQEEGPGQENLLSTQAQR